MLKLCCKKSGSIVGLVAGLALAGVGPLMAQEPEAGIMTRPSSPVLAPQAEAMEARRSRVQQEAEPQVRQHVQSAAVLFDDSPAQTRVVESLHDPVRVILQTPVDSRTAEPGELFSAVLPYNLQYQNQVLPAETVFSGRVVKVRPESRRFGMPAYVTVDIQEAVLPDGTHYWFPETRRDETRIRHPEARGAGDFVRNSLPLTVVSAGTSIPLRVATDLPGGVVTAISYGARAVTGVTMELLKPPEELPPQRRPVPNRVGYGMLRATGIVGAINMMTVAPEPSFQPGDTVNLHLDESNFRRMFTGPTRLVRTSRDLVRTPD